MRFGLMIAVDTNVLVRLLTEDNLKQAAAARSSLVNDHYEIRLAAA